MKLKPCPNVIYLQATDEDYEEPSLHREITWCVDQINNDDTAYVRLDRLTTAVKMIQMAMTGNADYNAGMVAALLIIDEQFEEGL